MTGCTNITGRANAAASHVRLSLSLRALLRGKSHDGCSSGPEQGRLYLDQLDRRSSEIASWAGLTREFFRIIRERDTAAGTAWRNATTVTPFANFTKHLCRDEAAFLAALQQPWSNGPVEGHIRRLKLIKRSMYGRANFDLLCLRFLHAA